MNSPLEFMHKDTDSLQREMAWLSSKTFEYHNVCDKRSISQLLVLSTEWEKVSKAKQDNCLYEEIFPTNANRTKDHVLIYPTTTLVEDCHVLEIVEKASNWDYLMKDVHGFTVAMHQLAELLNKTNWYLTDKLNDLLNAEGLGKVSNVSEVINKASDKYTPKKQKQVLKIVLKKLFEKFVSDEHIGSLAMMQWHKCLSCLNKRNAISHPLGLYFNHINSESLTAIKADVKENPDYNDMRDVALVMVQMGEKMVADGVVV